MANNINEKTEETIEPGKLTQQEEQEAYFLLIQIFSNAQATQNQAQFEHDLSEWKKRFQIDLFSDEYKRKIKYMLSKEFLDTIIKNFSIYQEQAQMDYSKGLEKLHKIFNRAEKHKNAQQLDKDLDTFFSIYSKDIFKKNYPHIMARLLSTTYRTKVLEKFDSSLAYKELTTITEYPQDYTDANDFKAAIEAWQKLYPIADFNDKYKSQVEQTLSTTLDERKLEELFPVSTELDLTEGQVVALDIDPFDGKTRSLFFENARLEFFDIVNVNIGDTDRLFSWIYKYGKYINAFDTDTKNAIVNNLMKKYHNEFHSSSTHFQMPKMDSGIDELLSLSEFESIDDTKKQVVLQLLGILYNGMELTDEDIYRLNIINSNVQKVRIIEDAKISEQLDDFMKDYSEDALTPSDNIALDSTSDTTLDISVSDDIDLELGHDENSNIVITEKKVHTTDPTSFKTSLKVEETLGLERVSSTSNTSSTSDSGNNAGGSSISIEFNELETIDENEKNIDENDKDTDEENVSNPSIMISNVINDMPEPELDEKIEIRKIDPNTENSSIETTTEPTVEDIHEPPTEIVDNLEKDSISSEDNINSTDDSYIASVGPETSEPEKTAVNIETSKPEEPFVNTEVSDSEKEITPTKPFQNFFNRLLGRGKSDDNDDRDDR